MITHKAVFQSTLPARGATSARRAPGNLCAFQSTLPARGATLWFLSGQSPSSFQSTLPARGATSAATADAARRTFQSTLPARGATPPPRCSALSPSNFNPRSPHGERLQQCLLVRDAVIHFNPRSPHGERRDSWGNQRKQDVFQSTLPARGATRFSKCFASRPRFQSTLPARGATRPCDPDVRIRQISIHAPRTGSDQRTTAQSGGAGNFNPRSPHGERQGQNRHDCQRHRFQSTLPARGATASIMAAIALRGRFQSTLPARGATKYSEILPKRNTKFQSTLPARGATAIANTQRGSEDISIHAPRTGSDCAK